MKKINKRILSLALAFFLGLALLPAPALAYGTGIAGQANTVSAGWDHTGFVDKDSTLWMWGKNSSGQLGNGGSGNMVDGNSFYQTVPVVVLDNVAAVSCGNSHTAAIRTDGTLWMWGYNGYGLLGNGTKESSNVPIKVLDNVAAVSCGWGDYTAAIKTDGTLWMWGDNNYGQLGNGGGGNDVRGYGNLFYQTVPVKVLDNVVAVSCGNLHTAAIKTDGTLWMWGNNDSGRLGNGGSGNAVSNNGFTIQTVPVRVLDNVVAVSCGNSHTAAIRTDGSLWMWGNNAIGQLGHHSIGNAMRPVHGHGDTIIQQPIQTVPVKVLDNVAAVSCGNGYTAAIKTDGTLWMWGDNNYGQLGNGGGGNALAYGEFAIQTVPIKVLDNVAAVSCGDNHTAAVKADGTFWTWGYNRCGQLGNNSVEPQLFPIQIKFMPSYSYPDADTGSDAVQAAAQGSEVSAAYQLADGLYYVLLNQDGTLVGRVVKGVKEAGQTVWKVIQSHDEPAAQEELDALVSQELSTPNLSLDFGRLPALSAAKDAADYLREQLDNLDGLTVNDPAKAELASFLENAMASLASASLLGPGNRLTVSADTVSSLIEQAQSARAELDGVLSDHGVALNKELEVLLRVLWQDVDRGEPCQVTLDRDLADALGGSSLRVLLGSDRHYIQLSADNLSGLLEQYGTLSIQTAQNGENTYAVNFLDKDGNVLEQIGFPVMVGLPASGPLNTIMASYEGGSDNWGGQYDESAGTMAFETRYSGQYEVLENDVAISDIGELDQETQSAIAFLVSKGYMSAPDGAFQPSLPLTRYDFTQTLVGMFFALDRGLTTSFSDVPQDSPYYAYVASAEADEIVEGYGDGTFSGGLNITVEQMLALAARTLRERKGYLAPENADAYLSSFADADQISGWAKELAAQTVRDEIMDRTDTLNPKGDVTRAQAALILYRLFLRLYEVSPVALDLPAPVEAPAEAEDKAESASPAEDKAPSGGFPVEIVIAAAAVVLAGGAAATALALKKKKAQAAVSASAEAAPPVQEPAPAPTPKFCAGCGKPLEANAKFCPHCGKSVE